MVIWDKKDELNSINLDFSQYILMRGCCNCESSDIGGRIWNKDFRGKSFKTNADDRNRGHAHFMACYENIFTLWI